MTSSCDILARWRSRASALPKQHTGRASHAWVGQLGQRHRSQRTGYAQRAGPIQHVVPVPRCLHEDQHPSRMSSAATEGLALGLRSVPGLCSVMRPGREAPWALAFSDQRKNLTLSSAALRAFVFTASGLRTEVESYQAGRGPCG
jgi:hypothetical protein